MPDYGSEMQNKFCIPKEYKYHRGLVNPCLNGRTHDLSLQRYMHIVLKTPKVVILASGDQAPLVSEDCEVTAFY